MKREFETLNLAIKEAAKIAKRYIGKADVHLKGRANLVTQADLACQKKIIQIISARHPDHSFLAEEEQTGLPSSAKAKSRYVWVIDPIDGTANYAHTFAHSGISVALTLDGKPILGGVYDIFKDEFFTAIKGKGAKLNGKKIHVSNVKKLKDSLLVTGFPYKRENIGEVHLPIFKDFILICHDVRRTGAASLDLCWTAAGRLDGYWEFDINPWDVCAGKLILEEAGGKVTDFKGKPWKNLADFGRQTLASNGKIHREMLKIFDNKRLL